MTREEAIIDLNALKFILDNDQYTDEIEEALDAAISALQQSDHIADDDKKDDHFREVTKKVDVISRQAAIDAECEVCQIAPKKDRGHNCIYYVHGCKEIECLRALPSAQPERTCVNCGRTVNNGGWYADGRTRCPIEEHYALPKDGYCHLWEKRNVTDDDYPERRTDE